MLTQKYILFAPIAERESKFYVNVIKQLKDEYSGYGFLSFCQPGNDHAKRENIDVYDVYNYLESDKVGAQSINKIEEIYCIDNINKLLVHESVTFCNYDKAKLVDKFVNYLLAVDRIFLDLLNKYDSRNIFVFQELGGFIAPLSLYFNCKKYNINHTFFEPSYFKGRIHFNTNTLAAFIDYDLKNDEMNESALEYVNQALVEKSIVIPLKDQAHYAVMGFRKIFNLINIKKTLIKLKLKYIYGYKQEYDHIYNHIKRYLQMYLNKLCSVGIYTNSVSDIDQKYIFFPLHVKLDYSLTIRSLEYFNQLAFLEYLCNVLPFGYLVVTKEHPATEGGFRSSELRDLIKKNSNLRILKSKINAYDIVEKSECVVTVNSKVGYEALTKNKEVVVLGNAHYRESGLVWKIEKLSDCEEVLREILLNQKKKNISNNRLKFFSRVWRSSYSSELYNNDNNNVVKFVNAIKKHILKIN